jgi:hypothetical protein
MNEWISTAAQGFECCDEPDDGPLAQYVSASTAAQGHMKW